MSKLLFGEKLSCRMACIFLVMILGMFLFTACGSDSAEDLVRDVVDLDFDEDAEIELDDVTSEKTVDLAASAVVDGCGTTSVAAELAKLEDEIDDLDKVDIDDVELNYVTATYTATWEPVAITTLTCRLTISGTQNTELEATAINRPSGQISLSLTPDQRDVINYYLSNRNEPFDYCLVCDNDDAIDTYRVTYSVEIGVTISGNI